MVAVAAEGVSYAEPYLARTCDGDQRLCYRVHALRLVRTPLGQSAKETSAPRWLV